ncbi:unnamed protein product [Cylindrotheca closterium]|uniref:Uncharacterized protein n=1 Tax=Cylindrotheca closterium TaxID=2856 RepID=A0AAD2G840_9STRA|nr:unnamed protein product [Cylindrotheca closterium]
METTKDDWNESMRLNNLGVQYLLQGILKKACQCFREAAEYNEKASYESSIDEFGVYANEWVSLSQAINIMHEEPFRPSVLSIGHKIQEDTFFSDTDRRKYVFTSRLDWIIDFNLATALQLCGILLHDGSSLTQAYKLYDEMSTDVIEWNDYSVSVDMAMFLMTIYQNQRIICKLYQNEQLAVVLFLRIRHIQQSFNGMMVRPDCIVIDLNGVGSSLQQQISLSTLLCKDDHCAPVA